MSHAKNKLYNFGIYVHRKKHYYMIVTGNGVYTLFIIGHYDVCSAKNHWGPYQLKLTSYCLDCEEGGQRLKPGKEGSNFVSPYEKLIEVLLKDRGIQSDRPDLSNTVDYYYYQ